MFIGRQDELDRLRAHLTSADGRAHRMTLIEGPIGIGKTTLVHEFLRAGVAERVLFARPDELATNIPLAGIRTIVEDLLDADLPALLAEEAPRRIHRRLVEALTERPSLVVIDDAHWLDDDALGLLERLLASPPTTAVTLLLCFRTGTVPDRLLRAGERSGSHLQRLEIGPLSRDEAATMLAEHGGRDDGLLDLARGNPLFLRLLADGRSGVRSDGPGLPDIGDALRGELSALESGELTLLQALSLTPPPSPAAVAEICGADAEQIAADAEGLARRGLVDADALTVVHPFVRAAAYRSMRPAVRRRAHRIASRRASDLLDRASHLQHLGSHLEPAELSTVVEAAVVVSATSPRSAVALLQPTRRLPHHERDLVLARALLLDGRPADAEDVLRRAHATRPPAGEALALLIQSLRIQSRPDEAFELVRDAGGAGLEPEVLVELATLAVMHDGDAEIDARTWLKDDDARPGHATALAGLRALSHLRVGDLERGRAAYQVAKAGFEALPAAELLPVIDAVTAMGWCAHFLADFTDGALLVERAIRLAESRGRFHVLPHLYLILAFLCIPLDRCEEAEELCELSIAAAERYNWPDAVPLALTASIVAAPGRVGPEEIAARYKRLVDAGLPQVGWWRRIVRLFRARVSIKLGLPVDADDLAVDENDIFASQKHIGLGEMALGRGDVPGALAHAAASISWGERAEHPSQAGHGTMFRAQVRAAQGDLSGAIDDARTAAALFEEAGTVLYRRFAEAMAAQLTAASAPPTSAGLDVLTRREQDVAELVADGHTNRAIAERLHLSPRTVESHVARILQKTGLRSRAGIARHLDAGGRSPAPR